MSERMQRIWMPFRTGKQAITAATDVEVVLTTLIDVALDRDMSMFTVTRMIFGFSCSVDSGVTEIFSLGIQFVNENVGIGVITPDGDATASWLYWEEVMATVNTQQQRDRIIRDIGTQRKSQGSDQDLLFKISNPGASAGDFMLSGRVLALVR